jgi:hypothetical protein
MRTLVASLLLAVSMPLWATPSTLVTIPSTDIQAAGTWHLGADTIAYLNGSTTAPFFDLGLTYGAMPRVEVGVDMISPTENPIWLNGKVLLLSPDQSPVALAAGIYNAATSGGTKQNVAYVIGSGTVGGVRVHLGGFQANDDVFGADDTGFMVGLDKTIDKWWLGADYLSGKNPLGSWNLGVGYALTDKIGVIVGYDHYNVGAPHSVNFQLDINL